MGKTGTAAMRDDGADTERRRELVLEAGRLFSKHGYERTTVRELARAGLALGDIDWIEINEAFASVVLAWQRELGANLSRVNPWGGAIAHGHPLGATGAGLMGKMLAGLEATEGELGMQLMCIGHGMATATIIQRL